MFERANANAGTSAKLHALRHTAAFRMAEDPSLPLIDVQFVFDHAHLTTTQLYLTPRQEVVIRRLLAHQAEQTRRAAARAARLRQPTTGWKVSMCCSGPVPGDPHLVDEYRLSHTGRGHGIVMVLDWLEDQPGQTWQERWQASGIEQTGAAWQPVIQQWPHEHGLKAAWRMPAAGLALMTLISADLLRPSVDWLAAGASRRRSPA
ncbi:tyrosine-type recombinase/integrase [Streptomyces sp. Inha503]|uniref:tyrosine-type recombinase/integrase n=1 Tax=Streptomyces sp. Inha503 TaxID=3383314 RepID=UPI00399FC55C